MSLFSCTYKYFQSELLCSVEPNTEKTEELQFAKVHRIIIIIDYLVTVVCAVKTIELALFFKVKYNNPIRS